MPRLRLRLPKAAYLKVHFAFRSHILSGILEMKAVFVITSFDNVQILKSLGYSHPVLQIGRGAVAPEPFSTEPFTLEVYRYKEFLKKTFSKPVLSLATQGQEAVWRVWRKASHLW